MISQAQQMMYRLNNLDTQQQKISYQMSSKKELQNGSDDSVLYARIISVDDKIRTYEGLQSQIERTTLQNDTSDSSLSEIKKILEFVKQELIKANTATTTPEGITAIASNISGIKENIYQLANTQVEGEYVFAGSDSSIQAFEKDATTGKVTYQGDNQLRKIAVEEDSYREKGVTGFDMMMYPSASAYKNKDLSFKATDRIVDQNRNEWKLNSPANNTLTKYDSNGNITATTLAVTNDGATPPTYKVTTPNVDGTKFEAKTNIFDLIDSTVNALKKVDSSGNSISNTLSKTLIGNSLTEFDKAFDAVNVAHADLGGKNQVFEFSLERISSKLTQYNVLSEEISGADLTKVAMEAKALELTYTALYSTISKTNQLSLVNFLN